MEGEEVDAWYDEEKQRIFDNYLKNLGKNNDKEKLDKEYKKEMSDLRKKYITLYEKSKKPSITKKVSGKVNKFMDKLVNIYK
ncbi:MAG: hypothetical protein U9O94_02905 [Nanoarchaeota archaeon]|nr:hypothetical protein [Nanoarchaeota archaeon]